MSFEYIESTDYHFNIKINIDLDYSINEIINIIEHVLSDEFNKTNKYIIIKELTYSNWGENHDIEAYVIVSAISTKQSLDELENRIVDAIDNNINCENTYASCVKTQP